MSSNRGVGHLGSNKLDRVRVAEIVNATVIRQEDAPQGCAQSGAGAARKAVIDPLSAMAKGSASTCLMQ